MNDTTDQHALLILGMHRSGTSALAGLTTLLGVAPPARLIAPTHANPRGYWESPEIAMANEAMLNLAGCGWDDSLLFDVEQVPPEERGAATMRFAALLRHEFGDAPIYVLKDPRLCLLLDLWLPALPSPHVLLALRHPGEVVASLTARNHTPTVVSVALWLHHMLEAEFRSRNLPRAFVSYDNLLQNWRDTLTKAGAQAEIPWGRDPWSVAAHDDELLDLTLRHHVNLAPPHDIAPPPLGPWTALTWDLLRANEADPSSASLRARKLDEVRTAFGEWRRRLRNP